MAKIFRQEINNESQKSHLLFLIFTINLHEFCITSFGSSILLCIFVCYFSFQCISIIAKVKTEISIQIIINQQCLKS